MLAAIRAGIFAPDVSRSGRFGEGGLEQEAMHEMARHRGLALPNDGQGGGGEPDAGPGTSSSSGTAQAAEGGVPDPVAVASSTSFSSSSSSDSDSSEVTAAVEQFDLGPREANPYDQAAFYVYKHGVFGTLHLRRKTVTSRLQCGRALHRGFTRLEHAPPGAVLCKQCFTAAH